VSANNSPRKLAHIVLIKVRRDRAFASLTLDHEIAKVKMSLKDKALATELVYGVLRNRLLLDYRISSVLDKSIKKIEPLVLDAIRIGAYQIFFLDRIPTHAIVDESVKLAPKRAKGLVNAVLRKLDSIKDDIPPVDLDEPAKKLSIETSHPLWIVKKFIERFGFDGARDLCIANQKPAPNTIRTNSLKTHRDDLISFLFSKGVEAEKTGYAPLGLTVKKLSPLLLPEIYKKGFFIVQGEGAQLVTELLTPKPGEKILDACAAPGVKATHIAQKMNNDGLVIACDVSRKRLALVGQNANLLGATIIKTMAADLTRKAPMRLGNNFDKVLVDAPGSGLGDLGKNPDARYNKSPGSIRSLMPIQRLILENVAPLVKPKGRLIYSTCTLTLDENEKNIASFLRRHPEFEEVNAGNILGDKLAPFINEKGHFLAAPHITGTNGFFAVVLKKSF